MNHWRAIALVLGLLLGADLAQAAQVFGTVRRADTNAPLVAAQIQAFVLQPGGGVALAGFGITDTSGNYALTLNLAPNNYLVLANASGFVSELFDNVPCTVASCNISAATTVPIAAAGFAANINFALDLAPRVSGTVRREDNAAPIAGVRVTALGLDGAPGEQVLTAIDGSYTLTVPVGGAYVVAGGAAGYVHELHPNVLCPYRLCERSGGTVFNLGVGQLQSGVDFALAPGGGVSGVVLRADTGMPLDSGVSVDVYINDVDVLTTVVGASDGSWQTDADLPAGNYRVRARADQFYAWQMYDNRECTGANFDQCDVAAADPVAVAINATTPDIDFALRRVVASLSGRVTDLATGAPLINIAVEVRGPDNVIVAQGLSDGAGDWRVDNLQSGTYTVLARSPGPPYLNEFYPNVQCTFADTCAGTPTSFVVAAGATVANIDFALAPPAQVDIGLRNADTATLMAGEIRARLPGLNATQIVPTTAGSRTRLFVLSGGPVRFAGTALSCGPGGDRMCLAERYPDTPCALFGCGLDDGAVLNVPKGATLSAVDLDLTAGASIAGTVRAADTLVPLADTLVEVSTGDVAIASTTSVADGTYRIDGLGAGPYFVRTRTPVGYLDELYDDLPCALGNCNAATGLPVAPPPGGTADNIDFALAPGAGISGVVRDALTAQTLVGARVSVFDNTGLQIAGMSTAAGGAYQSPALPMGNYFVRAERQGYESVLFQNIACPGNACDPTSGMPVAVAPPSNTQGVDFALPPDATPRPPTVLYLNRCAGNCSVTRGPDDSRFNRSSIVPGSRILPPYPYDQGSFDALVACMREVWQPYNVEIVTTDPSPAAHQELMLTTTPGVAGFSNGVAGVSPFTCGTIPNAITFLFATAHPDDTDELCHTAAMELAHSFGLDHEVQCSDPMTYLSGCGRKRFTDIDAPCGEYGTRACTCGGATQNSHRFLQGAVGVNPEIFADSFEAQAPAIPKRVAGGPPMLRLPDTPHCGTREQPVQTLLETWWWEGLR